jgi:hypothetical protein
LLGRIPDQGRHLCQQWRKLPIPTHDSLPMKEPQRAMQFEFWDTNGGLN